MINFNQGVKLQAMVGFLLGATDKTAQTAVSVVLMKTIKCQYNGNPVVLQLVFASDEAMLLCN